MRSIGEILEGQGENLAEKGDFDMVRLTNPEKVVVALQRNIHGRLSKRTPPY